MHLYHITPWTDWAAGQAAGAYTAASLQAQGFIHASTREQVLRTAALFYRGVKGLALLRIDAGRLSAPVRWENTEGGEELFPHLYGALNLDAVDGVADFPPGPDGTFAFPPDLESNRK